MQPQAYFATNAIADPLGRDPDPSANSPAREAEARAKWDRLWRLLLADDEPRTAAGEVASPPGEVCGHGPEKVRAAALDAHRPKVSKATTPDGIHQREAMAHRPSPQAAILEEGRAAND